MGGRVEGGRGRGMVSRRAPPVPQPGPSAAAGGWLVGPGPSCPHGWRRGAARPSLPRARSGLFCSPGRRARSGSPPVGQSGWGGGRSVRCLPSGARWGGPGVRRGGVRSAPVFPSVSPGRASKRAALALPSPWREWRPYCTGSCLLAAARMRSAGCPCAPAQGCCPAAVTLGAGGRRTGGARRIGPVAPLPGCPGPLGEGGGGLPWPGGGVRGRHPPRNPPAVRWLGGGEGGGGGGSPLSPPLVPRCLSPVAAGQRTDSLGPGGSAVDGGGREAWGWAPSPGGAARAVGPHSPPTPFPSNGR